MTKLVWHRLWGRKFAPLLGSVFMFAYWKNREFGIASNKLFVQEGNLMSIYFNKPEFWKVMKNYERFLRRQNLNNYSRVYEQEYKDFLIYARKISILDPLNMSTKQLSSMFSKLVYRLQEFSYSQFHTFLVLVGASVDLETKLSRQPGGAELLQAIITPYRETNITKARLEFLKIAQTKSPAKKLSAYAKKYAWLPVYEPLDQPWTSAEFKAQLKQIKHPTAELAEYRKHRAAGLRKFKHYFASIKDKNFKKQVEIVHCFSYLKEMRDDYRRPSYYLLGIFLKKLAKVLGVSFAELNHMTILEIAESINQGRPVVAKSELTRRQKAFALVFKHGRLQVLSGRRATALGQKVAPKPTAEIKGTPANPGKVKGKVSVIYHQGEFKKFKQNEILVTTMTHPEFLPIMKKAKAVVTDEGGIICHAAIVARELGIPCVIGAKNATQALKDGDVVEVDATAGTVKIIK